MVTGIDIFRSRFAAYSDSYVLIGGAACDVLLERAVLPFRVTHDLDIVLCVEALTPEFGRAFWDFVRDGGYEVQEKSSGARKLYRFRRPKKSDFPEMLELFSRRPDIFEHDTESNLTPIPMEDEVSSLSAILLDDDYYSFIQGHKQKVNGLSILSVESLIVLKAKAWLDLSERKAKGEAIDTKNIRKHKNDVCRLVIALNPQSKLVLPAAIRLELIAFLDRMPEEPVDFKALSLALTMPETIIALRRLFAL